MYFKNKKISRVISLILSLAMALSLVSTAVFAAQSNEYTDPADVWLEASGRTNEFDVNATITYETQFCFVCMMETSMMNYRVPEYTKSGETALNHNVMYSDGTCIDGVSTGNIDDGDPGVDSFYTGYHWTKSICQNCGTINSVDPADRYDHGKNVYILYSCDSNFFLDFDNTTYSYHDDETHTTVLKKGQYCQFCKGTYARATTQTDPHDMDEKVEAQLGNQRFHVTGICSVCGYNKDSYVLAKSVVRSYYGKVDGQAHSIVLNDLSEKGVNTSIRYGESADNCTLTSAPSYTDEGYYPVYYEITYTYGGTPMVEDGVSYVWLIDTDKKNDTPMATSAEVHVHDFRFLETVRPTCTELGYDIFQCSGCGALKNTNYTPAVGHDYEKVVVREPSCTQGGFEINSCKKCGAFYTESTAMTAHEYEENTIPATCTTNGYTEHRCTHCGITYNTDLTPLKKHNYNAKITNPTCTAKGFTTYTCDGCGESYISDYTEPQGHSWNNGHLVTSATCEGAGIIEYDCTRCGETMIEAVNPKGHTPGAAATCTTPQTCTVCGAVIAQATGHHYNQRTVTPTCTTDGYTEYTCRDCGVRYIDNHIARTNHNYRTAVTPATCTSFGYTTYTCNDCGETFKSDYTDKAPHHYHAKVTPPTCTELGYTTYTCANCGDEYISDYVETVPHNYRKQTVEPTCTENGYTVYTCPDCGKEYIGDYKDAKQHDFKKEVTRPACTEMGYTTYTCADCDYSYTADYTDPTGHDFTETVTEPTCTEQGYSTFSCKNCDYSYTGKETAKTPHNFTEAVTEPTCTEMGYMVFTCSDCEYSYTGAYTNAAGHKYDADVVEPDCEHMGYTIYTCSVCGDSYVGDYTDPVGHKYKSKVKIPTCTEMGYTTYTCEVCGDSYKGDYKDPAGHKYEENITDATCTELGYTEYFCIMCGERHKGNETATIPHNYTKTVTEPTCSTMGYTTYTCRECGYTYNGDYTDPLEHKYVGEATEPTCTKMGYITYTCSECGDSYIGNYLDPTGHMYSETITDATCTELGYTTFTCLICGETHKANETALVPHKFNKTVKKPTCKEMGYTVFTCKDCGYTYTGDYKDPSGHRYEDAVTDPTCVHMGYTTKTCKICGDSFKTDYTDPTGHKYEEVDVGATCTELGYTEFTCTVCGETHRGNETAMVPHNYTKTVTEPTCKDLGFTTYTCADCGYTFDGEYVESPGHTPTGWIIDEPATIEHDGSKHVECSVCGEVLDTAVIPMLTDKDNSDEDGYSKVGKYTIILTDKNGKPVFNSEITIDADDNISIVLPSGRLLDYEDRTTITVTYTDSKEPAEDLDIVVSDENSNAARGTTDENGRLTVPNGNTSTGNDNGTVGGETEDSKFTYVVTVTDKNNKLIPDCNISVDENGGIFVQLPAGTVMDFDNRITVTVKNQSGVGIHGVDVAVSDENGRTESGATNAYGILTVPNGNSGYTDEKGFVNVNAFMIIVEDETGYIRDAYVTFSEQEQIKVELPEGKYIDYDNRTTVTVLMKDGTPVENTNVTVSDYSGKSRSGSTNAEGKVTVPPWSEDYTDENGEATVDGMTVIVEDENARIEDALVCHILDEITVALPASHEINADNRIIVTVLKGDEPVVNKAVIVTDIAEASEKGYTDENGQVIVPPLDEDYTDEGGTARVHGYTVIVNDETEFIEDAYVEYAEEKISVKLPEEKYIDYDNRITVTVLDGEKPVPDMDVEVSDILGKSMSGVTDENGQVTVPPRSEDYTDADGQAYVNDWNVIVENRSGMIEDAYVTVNDGKISVKLPDKYTLTASNQTTVTVTNSEGGPVKDIPVTVTDKNSAIATKNTDSSGRITVPVKTSGGGGGFGGGGGGFGTGGGGGFTTSNSYSVTVVDKDGRIVNASTSVSGNSIDVTLPNSTKIDGTNYYTITVTDRNGAKKSDMTVNLKDIYGNADSGVTDANGQVVLPAAEHKSYITGYPGGTFNPDGNMTRAEAAAIFARNIAERKGETISNVKSSFWDIENDEWYASYIGYLEKYKIITGYDNNTFMPQNRITRAEFVAMSVRFYELFDKTETSANNMFSDVPATHWALGYINTATTMGWIKGYTDGTFMPNSNITRAEVVTIVNRITDRHPDSAYIDRNITAVNKFSDLKDKSYWAFYEILEAATTHTAATVNNNEVWVK